MRLKLVIGFIEKKTLYARCNYSSKRFDEMHGNPKSIALAPILIIKINTVKYPGMVIDLKG